MHWDRSSQGYWGHLGQWGPWGPWGPWGHWGHWGHYDGVQIQDTASRPVNLAANSCRVADWYDGMLVHYGVASHGQVARWPGGQVEGDCTRLHWLAGRQETGAAVAAPAACTALLDYGGPAALPAHPGQSYGHGHSSTVWRVEGHLNHGQGRRPRRRRPLLQEPRHVLPRLPAHHHGHHEQHGHHEYHGHHSHIEQHGHPGVNIRVS